MSNSEQNLNINSEKKQGFVGKYKLPSNNSVANDSPAIPNYVKKQLLKQERISRLKESLKYRTKSKAKKNYENHIVDQPIKLISKNFVLPPLFKKYVISNVNYSKFHISSRTRLEFPNGVIVEIQRTPRGFDVKIFPLQFSCHKSLLLLIEFLFSCSDYYISKAHYYLDHRVDTENAAKSAVYLGNHSTDPRYINGGSKELILSNPTYLNSRALGCTIYFGARSRKQLIIYNLNGKRPGEFPDRKMTRFEFRFNIGPVQPIDRFDQIHLLPDKIRFDKINFVDLHQIDGLNPLEKELFDLLVFRRNQIGLDVARGKLRNFCKTLPKADYKNIVKCLKPIDLDLKKLFKQKIDRLSKLEISETDMELFRELDDGKSPIIRGQLPC